MNTIERRKRDEDERQDWKEERSRKKQNEPKRVLGNRRKVKTTGKEGSLLGNKGLKSKM